MRIIRRRRNKKDIKTEENSVSTIINSVRDAAFPESTEHLANQIIRPVVDKFATHMAKYTGQTVTIFVVGGGVSGTGFTGILLTVNNIYVRLILRIGPPPGCALGNACYLYYPGGGYGYKSCTYPGAGITGITAVSTLGAVADIPVSKIISFVHINSEA